MWFKPGQLKSLHELSRILISGITSMKMSKMSYTKFGIDMFDGFSDFGLLKEMMHSDNM